MFKTLRSKHIAIGLVFSIFLFFSPQFLSSSLLSKGEIIGIISQNDGVTPVVGAVFKMRNVSTGSYYESCSTDENGYFTVVGVEEGLYVAGVTTKDEDFNIENLIGIKTDETANISIALDYQGQGGEAIKKNKRCPRGDWYVPKIKGQCDKNYKWDPETGRCECKKNLLGIFRSPAGIGIIVASTVAVVYTLVKLTEGEEEASPFKK